MKQLSVRMLLSFLILAFFHIYVEAKESTPASVIYPNFDDNPFISEKMRGKIFSYLLPLDHCIKQNLDDIFLEIRATKNLESFYQAGFDVISIRPNSFILVAGHSALPNHLVKVYLDNEGRLKRGLEGWKWFLKRCKGAEQIRKVIERKDLKHFVVPQKWIYPLPINPSPPANEPVYLRKEVILVVEKMDLVSYEENLEAWRTKITYRHLEEFYAIISRANGSSYRPDNVAFTKQEKFAFIDTEYPTNYPDYQSIKPYLSPEMLIYWEVLIRAGEF